MPRLVDVRQPWLRHGSEITSAASPAARQGRPPFLVLAFLTHELLTEIIVQQLAAPGERQRQLLRAANPFRRRREKALQQLADRSDAIFAQPEFRTFKIGGVAHVSR